MIFKEGEEMAGVTKEIKEALAKENIELNSEEMNQLNSLISQGKLTKNDLEYISGGTLSPEMKKALAISAILIGGVALSAVSLKKHREKKNRERVEEILSQTAEYTYL